MKAWFAGLFMCSLLLTGCGRQTDLFSGLTEVDANEVIAALAEQQIEANKRTEKNGVVVAVKGAAINRAVRVLEAAGLPRRARSNLGEIFKKEGVISTPLEERARYLYALSQELEATLSQIDGVIVARVHVVLPERVAPGEPVQPASAAVFIKYSSILDPDSVRGRIQQMVASSIPGMSGASAGDPRKFSIVFVPAAEFHDNQRLVALGPFLVESEKAEFWNSMIWLAPGVLMLCLLLMALMLRPDWRASWWRRMPLRRSFNPALAERA